MGFQAERSCLFSTNYILTSHIPNDKEVQLEVTCDFKDDSSTVHVGSVAGVLHRKLPRRLHISFKDGTCAVVLAPPAYSASLSTAVFLFPLLTVTM